MRSLLRTALAALLVLAAALPATAQTDEPLRLEPCTGTGEPLALDGASATLTAPTPVDGSTTTTYRLDLSGQEVADDQPMDDRASVTVDMTWMTPLDYDLDVNGSESINLQPLDPSAESVTVSVRHCGLVTITATNFAATGVEDLTIDVGVRL